MEEENLPCAPLPPERQRRRRGYMVSLSLQGVVLVDPAGHEADVSQLGFMDVADRRVHVLDHGHQLSDVSTELVVAAHPVTRDLVYSLNVFRSCSVDRFDVLSIDGTRVLPVCRL